jgi:hypothetical protein
VAARAPPRSLRGSVLSVTASNARRSPLALRTARLYLAAR